MKRLFAALIAFTALCFPARAAGFGDWSVAIVAGDYHAHSGKQSEVFDNARRDLALAFARAGFAPGNIAQYSVRPTHFPAPRPGLSEIQNIADTFTERARDAAGCLVYFTSHGAPEGIQIGDDLLEPGMMNEMLDMACGKRPTIAILSACYSGVFVPVLAAGNRIVFTAAMHDRPSFGCGEADRYTFFDTCVLASLPSSRDVLDMADRTRACVTAREEKEKVDYPSNPQLSVGEDIRAVLPAFASAGP